MRVAVTWGLVSCISAFSVVSAQGVEPVMLQEIKWNACDPQNSNDPCRIAYFRGNPEKETNFSYFKVPKGYLFSAHWHTGNEHLVVVKGVFSVGDEADPKGTTLRVGDYAYIPAKQIHWAKCAADECVVYLHVDGPDSYIDVKDRRP